MTPLDQGNTMSFQRISLAFSQLLNNSKVIHLEDLKRNVFNFLRLNLQALFISYAQILDFTKKELHVRNEIDPRRKRKTVLLHTKKHLQCGKLINKLKMGMYQMTWKRQLKPCQRKS